ncbi:unnamed protein product, partial [Nesidiocoris tenuis]
MLTLFARTQLVIVRFGHEDTHGERLSCMELLYDWNWSLSFRSGCGGSACQRGVGSRFRNLPPLRVVATTRRATTAPINLPFVIPVFPSESVPSRPNVSLGEENLEKLAAMADRILDSNPRRHELNAVSAGSSASSSNSANSALVARVAALEAQIHSLMIRKSRSPKRGRSLSRDRSRGSRNRSRSSSLVLFDVQTMYRSENDFSECFFLGSKMDPLPTCIQLSKSQESCRSESQTSSQNSSLEICRICHCEGDSECGLIAPCYCAGSLRYVHQSCLQQWIKSSNIRCCELCKFQFIMQTKTKPFMEWEPLEMTGFERRKLLCAVMFHAIALTCVVWSLYVLIHRTAEEIQYGLLEWPFWTKLIVVAIGFTGGVVFMYIQCKAYMQICQRWKAFNRCSETDGKTTTTPELADPLNKSTRAVDDPATAKSSDATSSSANKNDSVLKLQIKKSEIVIKFGQKNGEPSAESSDPADRKDTSVNIKIDDQENDPIVIDVVKKSSSRSRQRSGPDKIRFRPERRGWRVVVEIDAVDLLRQFEFGNRLRLTFAVARRQILRRPFGFELIAEKQKTAPVLTSAAIRFLQDVREFEHNMFKWTNRNGLAEWRKQSEMLFSLQTTLPTIATISGLTGLVVNLGCPMPVALQN